MTCSLLKQKWHNQSQIASEPKFQLVKKRRCKSGRPGTLLLMTFMSAPSLSSTSPKRAQAQRRIFLKPWTCLIRRYLDYDHARDELALAARTLPNNAWLFELTGYIDRRQGRWPDAGRNLKRAGELDPRNVHILSGLATTYLWLRDYIQLRNVSDRIQALDPANISSTLYRAWISVYERADTRPVHAAIEKILADDPARASALEETQFWLAWCERDFAAAERALAMMTENGNTFYFRGP